MTVKTHCNNILGTNKNDRTSTEVRSEVEKSSCDYLHMYFFT